MKTDNIGASVQSEGRPTLMECGAMASYHANDREIATIERICSEFITRRKKDYVLIMVFAFVSIIVFAYYALNIVTLIWIMLTLAMGIYGAITIVSMKKKFRTQISNEVIRGKAVSVRDEEISKTETSKTANLGVLAKCESKLSNRVKYYQQYVIIKENIMGLLTEVRCLCINNKFETINKNDDIIVIRIEQLYYAIVMK